MVCHIGGQLGTKVVISALGMLALYMCFNGTGIWGGETMLGKSERLFIIARCRFWRVVINPSNITHQQTCFCFEMRLVQVNL